MGIRFALIGSIAVVMLCGLTETASAQIVTVTNWNFNPSNPNSIPANRATINPVGTYTVPAPAAGVTENWKVVLDYGTLVNGTFTVLPPAQQPGTGLASLLNITNLNNNGPWNFGGNPGDTLNNPANKLPGNCAARIRLQKKINNLFQDQGPPAYLPMN